MYRSSYCDICLDSHYSLPALTAAKHSANSLTKSTRGLRHRYYLFDNNDISKINKTNINRR